MGYDDADNLIEEPPRHDMITVRFRGDPESITLPLCEVANGDIAELNTQDRIISVQTEDATTQLSFEAFVRLIDETFDIKEVVLLSLQPAGSYENTQIL